MEIVIFFITLWVVFVGLTLWNSWQEKTPH